MLMEWLAYWWWAGAAWKTLCRKPLYLHYIVKSAWSWTITANMASSVYTLRLMMSFKGFQMVEESLQVIGATSNPYKTPNRSLRRTERRMPQLSNIIYCYQFKGISEIDQTAGRHMWITTTYELVGISWSKEIPSEYYENWLTRKHLIVNLLDDESKWSTSRYLIQDLKWNLITLKYFKYANQNTHMKTSNMILTK